MKYLYLKNIVLFLKLKYALEWTKKSIVAIIAEVFDKVVCIFS